MTSVLLYIPTLKNDSFIVALNMTFENANRLKNKGNTYTRVYKLQ